VSVGVPPGSVRFERVSGVGSLPVRSV
jgi:hypothetical protein